MDRRQVLKYVMIGGVATAVVMPSKWVKPVVNAVIPPAHAAASAPATTAGTTAKPATAPAPAPSGSTSVNTPTGGTVTVTNNSDKTVTVVTPTGGVLKAKSVTYGGTTFVYPYN
jgi:hypothetical protein